jgi:hypothetical protein
MLPHRPCNLEIKGLSDINPKRNATGVELCSDGAMLKRFYGTDVVVDLHNLRIINAYLKPSSAFEHCSISSFRCVYLRRYANEILRIT